MAEQPLQDSCTALLSALRDYNRETGPCYCGKRRGHAGWLVCVGNKAKGEEA